MPALFQSSATPGDKPANIAAIARAAAAAASTGAQIITFPELFLTGYNLGTRLRDLAEPIDGPSVGAISDIARTHGIAIVLGMPERDGDRVFNTALAVDATGAVAGRYRKIHLFGDDEPSIFTPGEGLTVITVGPFKVGLAICYDIEFPELARALARGGADLIAVPTANMLPYTEVPTTAVRARALENGVAVIYANLIGTDGSLTYTGGSAIVGFDGHDRCRAGFGTEALLSCTSESVLPSANPHPLASTQLRDVRPEALFVVD